MKKVRAEQFKTWFPNNPEAVLQDFLNSGKSIMNIVFELSGESKAIELSQRDAAHLLEEFKEMKSELSTEI